MKDYPYIDIHTHSDSTKVLSITSVGIHPWDTEECDWEDQNVREEFERGVIEVDAVGEVGLDFAADVDRDLQQELFFEQLKLAKKHRKVVVLHCVKAFDATMQMLAKFKLRGVIFHGFIGSVQQMNQAVERGYYISFGERAFASPKSLKALRELPIEQLFLESDTSNTPIEAIYERISHYRMESVDELREAIYNNFIKLFPERG